MKSIHAVILGLVMVVACGPVFAKGDDLAATVVVHEDAAGKLDMLGSVAVVMSGNDPFINRIMEDVLAIRLMDRGIKVAYPDETHFARWREAVKDPMVVARSSGANVLLTGMLVTEWPGGDGSRAGGEHCRGHGLSRSMRLSLASLSLIDIPHDKYLVCALYEPESPVTSTRIAREFINTLVKSLD